MPVLNAPPCSSSGLGADLPPHLPPSHVSGPGVHCPQPPSHDLFWQNNHPAQIGMGPMDPGKCDMYSPMGDPCSGMKPGHGGGPMTDANMNLPPPPPPPGSAGGYSPPLHHHHHHQPEPCHNMHAPPPPHNDYPGSAAGSGGGLGSPSKELCCGCGRPIEDRYLLRVMDNSWHETCLQCAVCRHPLTQSCFVKDSKLLCRADYDRFYGAKCCGCLAPIPPHELVMRALGNVYHVRCFMCVVCGQQLQKGDQFVVKDGQIFCRHDFENDYMQRAYLYGGGGKVDEWGAPYSPKSDGDSILDDGDGDQPKGPKRPRTILTTSQRRKFKSSFEINPKPCRKVREALAAETGLSVRVVQVWFQNQRAKMKKIARKQANKAENGKDDKNTKKINKKKEDGDSDDDSVQNDSTCSISQGDSGFLETPASIQPNKLDSLEDVFMNQAQQGAAGAGGAPQPQQAGPVVNPIDKLYSMQSSYFNGD